MSKGYKVSKKTVTQALVKNKGLISQAAKTLNVNRRTIERWIDKYPEIMEDVEAAQQEAIEVSRGIILERIYNKKSAADAKWWLKMYDNDIKQRHDLKHEGNMTHEVNHNIGEVQKAIDLIPDDVLRELLNGDERSGSKGNRKKKSGTK